MTLAPTLAPTSSRTSLRPWPGVAIVILQWLLWFVLPVVWPDATLVGMIGGVVGALAILIWWLFFSRAPWIERVGGLILIVAAVLATKRVVHESIAGAGQGMLLYIWTIPGLCLALVVWAAATRRSSDGVRRASLVAVIVLACTPWILLRTAGVIGAGSDFHWRWTPTPEQRLLALADDEPETPPPSTAPLTTPEPLAAGASDKHLDAASDNPAAVAAVPAEKTESTARTAAEMPADWPGFRGPGRDSIIHGVHIETDWSKSPPVALWRRPIGPGWSSFAVHGDLLYTQEQRGDDEIVACYNITTGKPVWMHRDATRFWESNGGAGPRATPTLSRGRVYTFGATGILNALDARTGAVVWSRNAASDTHREIPEWGFTSSPLVVDDSVIIAVSGTLAAYDAITGKPRWVGPQHGGTYSSPQLFTIHGVAQILLLSPPGVVSLSPVDGALLWEHSWDGGAIVQPALTAEGDVLISAQSMTGGTGVRRLAVAHGSSGWTVEERWTSTALKPYFNDYVVHKGHAFGFDGSILACIDLKDGKRKWKGGRYGNGQLILLPDQDVLVVLSEDGELVLVAANADQFTELARFPAIEGKTWNHPVLVRDILLARNGQQMVAFRLPLAGR
jgi:outer membrane protein assembly factor BamB